MSNILYLKGFKDNKYLQQIINLESQLFTSSFKQIYRIDPNIEYYVYLIDNKVIGYLAYKDVDLSYDIIQIGVDKNYQHQGIATKLMQKIMDHCISLEVSCDNTNAIKLYEKLGFCKVCDLPNYYQGVDGIRMLYQP